jgi:hypothetical protein
MPPRDQTLSRFLYFTTACVKCCVAVVKSCAVLHFSVVIFGPSGPLILTLESVEYWVPPKPVLWDVRNVALFHHPSFTDSIKPSLQFLCNFIVVEASEGSHFIQVFIMYCMNKLVKDLFIENLKSTMSFLISINNPLMIKYFWQKML